MTEKAMENVKNFVQGKIQEPRSGNIHKFLALKPHCGDSSEKLLERSSTITFQFIH